MGIARSAAYVVGLLALLGGLLMTTSAANAAFPGVNGTILWQTGVPGGGGSGLWTMNPAGSGKQQIPLPPSITSVAEPAWSPDGTQIAFRGTTSSSGYDIFTMNADGTGVTDITNQGGFEVGPMWSPDGSKITYFHQDYGYGPWDIWSMNADGTGHQDLTNTPSTDEFFAAWSPDGQKIVFTSNATGNYDVYTMNPDGSNPVDLTNNPAEDGNGVLGGRGASWSPDGARIAFESTRDGNPETYVMNADGANVSRLTYEDSTDDEPVWSPDGQKFIFVSARNGNADLFTMDADGSNVVQVTTNSDIDTTPDWLRVTSATDHVTVDDSGFSPNAITLNQGDTLQWSFSGTTDHSANDLSALALFGSGPEPAGGAYAAPFAYAGNFFAVDTTTDHSGRVRVPVDVSPASGPVGTVFTVSVATAAPPTGYVFDVKIKRPGDDRYHAWRTNWLSPDILFTPQVSGTYSFKSRLRKMGSQTGLRWSGAGSCTVT